MPLAGTFDVLDFAETLTFLSKRGVTGRLQLRTASMHGLIWLAEGKAASAEVRTTNGGETKLRWRSHLDDLCFEAMRSAKGSFEFHPEDPSSVPTGPRTELESILELGRHRIRQWEDVEPVIRSFEAVPRLADMIGSESVTLNREQWRVVSCVDGRRNISALARKLDMDLLDFCQLLKPLVEGGAVELDQSEGLLKTLPKVRLEPDELPSTPGASVVSPRAPEDEEGVSLIDGSQPADAPDAEPKGWESNGEPEQDVHRRRLIRGRPQKPAESHNT